MREARAPRGGSYRGRRPQPHPAPHPHGGMAASLRSGSTGAEDPNSIFQQGCMGSSLRRGSTRADGPKRIQKHGFGAG